MFICMTVGSRKCCPLTWNTLSSQSCGHASPSTIHTQSVNVHKELIQESINNKTKLKHYS